jgi:AraC-like DNA-binding protein
LERASVETDVTDFNGWHDVMRRAYSLTRCQRLDDGPFTAKLATRSVGDMVVGRISSSPLIYRRGADEIRRNPIDHVLVLLLKRGQFGVCQGEKEVAASPGDIVSYVQSRPFELHIGSSYSAVTLSVPRQAITARGIVVKDLPGFTSGASPNGHLASRVFEEVAAALERPDCRGSDELLDALLDIFAVATRAATVESTSRSPQAFLNLVERRVTDRIDDPDLDLASMAQLCRVSLRTLNRAFAPLGTTPMRWLWKHRLNHARRLLTDRRVDSVTEASLLTGFKDVSHFSRAYRSAFGHTPSSLLGGGDQTVAKSP